MYTMIIISEIIKIAEIELLNKQHKSVIAAADTKAPALMVRKLCKRFKPANPEIMLADHTPVKGSGTETKVASLKYAFLLLFFPRFAPFIAYF